MGESNSREAIRPCFELLGPECCRQIDAVAMDMNTAFEREMLQHYPQAEVVDWVHVDQPVAIKRMAYGFRD